MHQVLVLLFLEKECLGILGIMCVRQHNLLGPGALVVNQL